MWFLSCTYPYNIKPTPHTTPQQGQAGRTDWASQAEGHTACWAPGKATEERVEPSFRCASFIQLNIQFVAKLNVLYRNRVCDWDNGYESIDVKIIFKCWINCSLQWVTNVPVLKLICFQWTPWLPQRSRRTWHKVRWGSWNIMVKSRVKNKST